MDDYGLVSVIIPVFNVKAYISEALDSVIYQTYGNLEIIIIDDGSTDGSGEVCDEYAQKDSRVITIHQENKGLSSARNKGLDNATGRFIAFLDPDDAYHPKMIQILTNELVKQAADIAVCNFDIFKTENRMLPTELDVHNYMSEVIGKQNALQKILSKQINTAVWDKVYAKSLWDNLRFPDGHVYEGTYIAFDLFDRVKKVVIVNEKLVMHRIRPHSICKTYSLKNAQDSQYALDHYSAYIINHTPEIFSYYQLKKYMSNRVRGLISECMFYQWENAADDKGIQSMRKILIKANTNGTLIHCGILMRLVYRMIILLPNCSRILYDWHRKIKDIIRREKTDHCNY